MRNRTPRLRRLLQKAMLLRILRRTTRARRKIEAARAKAGPIRLKEVTTLVTIHYPEGTPVRLSATVWCGFCEGTGNQQTHFPLSFDPCSACEGKGYLEPEAE
jgi:DnaJ-class molecular chaperone